MTTVCALFALMGCQEESATTTQNTEATASQEQTDAGQTGDAPAEPPAAPADPEPADEGIAEQDMAADAPEETAPAEELAPGETDVAMADMGGDPDRGRRVFGQCMACHVVQEGMNRVGPSLYNVVGRAAASVESFRGYSQAMKDSGIVWTEETLDPYLENPRAVVPGGSMAFAGLRNPQDRADVIAYLRANSPDAPPQE